MSGFTINFNNCVGGVRNTGAPLCSLDPNFITGSIHVPKGTILDGTTLTISAALTALLYNASKTSRGYPMYDFEKVTENSDKLVLQTMPTGARHPVREGFMDLMFQYFDGGLSKHQAARTFNGSNWDFYLLDTNPLNGLSNIYGIAGPTVNKLQAFPTNPGGFMWAHPITVNTGTERTAYMMEYVFKQTYFTDLIAAVACPFDFPTTLPGLNDVNVQASVTVNGTTGDFNVCLVSPLGTDIGALNSAALSGAGKTNWIVTGVAGASITPTSVTWVPSTTPNVPGYFTFVLPTTAPPYPTEPAPILINLVNAATLQAAGIDYESTGALSIASN